PGLRRETALAYKRLADISRLLGENDQATDAYGRATAMLTQLAAENPDRPEYRQTLADSYCYLGEVLRVTGRPEEALRAFQQALGLQERLTAEHPDRPEYRKDRAR